MTVNVPGSLLTAALGVFFLGVAFSASSIFMTVLGVIALLGAVVVLFDTEPEHYNRH